VTENRLSVATRGLLRRPSARRVRGCVAEHRRHLDSMVSGASLPRLIALQRVVAMRVFLRVPSPRPNLRGHLRLEMNLRAVSEGERNVDLRTDGHGVPAERRDPDVLLRLDA
jgi:hypothetical protein